MTVNSALRDHVTSAAFSLTLRRTHLEALAYIAWRLETDHCAVDHVRDEYYQRSPSSFVAGTNGLLRRGLIVHHFHPGFIDLSNMPFSDFYELTEAGRLVIGLLKEAGQWGMYAGAYPTVRAAVSGVSG